MKRVLSTILAIIACFVMGIAVLPAAGCSGEKKKKLPYNAELLSYDFFVSKSSDKQVFNKEFLKNNMICYIDDYVDLGDDIGDTENLPRRRGVVIDNQAICDFAFREPMQIDFEKNMIVVVLFYGFNDEVYELSEVEYNNKKLDISYSHYKRQSCKNPWYNDQIAPCPSYLIIKMEKLEVEVVEFL